MIAGFEDFCLYVYVIVDDIYQTLSSRLPRPGPAPACSDSELITIALVSEAYGWDVETELRDHWAPHLSCFPHFLERSRYNRRRRNLAWAINLIRRHVLAQLDLRQERECAIDSLPIPVVKFHLAPNAGWDWAAHGATFGRVSSKRQTIFGYKLHLLTTLSGLILDYELAPANATDLAVAEELLSPHTDLTILGDKAYVSQPFADHLAEYNRIHLITLRRKNQHQQLSPSLKRCVSQLRQMIETVTNQLAQQFNIERNRAHSFWGLCARLHSKLAIHTICLYINQLLGNPNPLHIKQLCFPSI